MDLELVQETQTRHSGQKKAAKLAAKRLKQVQETVVAGTVVAPLQASEISQTAKTVGGNQTRIRTNATTQADLFPAAIFPQLESQ